MLPFVSHYPTERDLIGDVIGALHFGSLPVRLAVAWEADGAERWIACDEASHLRALLDKCDLRTGAMADAACARTVARLAPSGDDRFARAIQLVESWARGDVIDDALLAEEVRLATCGDENLDRVIRACWTSGYDATFEVACAEASAIAPRAFGSISNPWDDAYDASQSRLAEVIRQAVRCPTLNDLVTRGAAR